LLKGLSSIQSPFKKERIMTTTKPKSWRDVPSIKVHPVAEVLKLLKSDELTELGKDIKKNGLHNPVITWLIGDDEYVMDGRNRLDAMEKVGMPVLEEAGDRWILAPPFCLPLKERDAAALIAGLNLNRRHLTAKERADAYAQMLKAEKKFREKLKAEGKIKEDTSKKPVGRPVSETTKVAKEAGVSAPTARQALVDAGMHDPPKKKKSKIQKEYKPQPKATAPPPEPIDITVHIEESPKPEPVTVAVNIQDPKEQQESKPEQDKKIPPRDLEKELRDSGKYIQKLQKERDKLIVSLSEQTKINENLMAANRNLHRQIHQLQMEVLDRTLNIFAGAFGKTPEAVAIHRKLAKKYHPDQNHSNPHAEEFMKDINELWNAVVQK
jgi:DnaJ domain